MKDSQPGAMIECYACRCWREIIETWYWVSDADKAKLRRRIARHKHAIRFETEYDFKRPGPVPAALLAHMPGLARAPLKIR